MRKRFEVQQMFDQTPIHKVALPLKSRDELPPILAALQWIFSTPEINEQIFQLLEKKVVGGKKKTGRPGMDLWHVLVLGLVRLALDCDYDRLEYLAHYDKLMRKILKKNAAEKIVAKMDTYVVEANVHFPTDLNLLWDAARKCIRLLSRLSEDTGLSGWRKSSDWEQQVKGLMRLCGRIKHSGGPNKEDRLAAVVSKYLNKAYQPSDSSENLALVDRLLKRFGFDAFSSISFDKGFSRESDKELIALYIPDVIMPKKSRLNSEEKAHEGTRRFKTLRHKHSAIESNINGLEHHGLNR